MVPQTHVGWPGDAAGHAAGVVEVGIDRLQFQLAVLSREDIQMAEATEHGAAVRERLGETQPEGDREAVAGLEFRAIRDQYPGPSCVVDANGAAAFARDPHDLSRAIVAAAGAVVKRLAATLVAIPSGQKLAGPVRRPARGRPWLSCPERRLRDPHRRRCACARQATAGR